MRKDLTKFILTTSLTPPVSLLVAILLSTVINGRNYSLDLFKLNNYNNSHK